MSASNGHNSCWSLQASLCVKYALRRICRELDAESLLQWHHLGRHPPAAELDIVTWDSKGHLLASKLRGVYAANFLTRKHLASSSVRSELEDLLGKDAIVPMRNGSLLFFVRGGETVYQQVRTLLADHHLLVEPDDRDRKLASWHPKEIEEVRGRNK